MSGTGTQGAQPSAPAGQACAAFEAGGRQRPRPVLRQSPRGARQAALCKEVTAMLPLPFPKPRLPPGPPPAQKAGPQRPVGHSLPYPFRPSPIGWALSRDR